jgi:DNA sulfur modification protein DndB
MTKTIAQTDDVAPDREDALAAECKEIWDLLTETMDQWDLVARGKEHPAYLRQRYLNMHGVGQQAIALAVAHAKRERNGTWSRTVRMLKKVDWRLTNSEWQGVALHGGRVNNTSTSIRMLAAVLEKKMGLSVGAAARQRSVGTG